MSAQPSGSNEPLTLVPPSRTQLQDDVAVLSPNLMATVSLLIPILRADLPGTDSGHPVERPHCVWLGRAPPVSLA